MRFILRGRAYNLSASDVKIKMKRVSPEAIRIHYVVVENRKYPPKQVLSEVLGLNRLQFTSSDAVNILRRLRFTLGYKKE